MVAILGVAHFSIPVSDVARSTQFYTEVVGCRHLSTVPRGNMAFLDAAGTCLILVKREPPINPVLDDHGGVHHSFIVAHDDYRAAVDHLRAHVHGPEGVSFYTRAKVITSRWFGTSAPSDATLDFSTTAR